MPNSHRSTGALYILCSVMVWAGWMVLSSYGVRGHLTAYDITALRFGTAGIAFLPIFLKRGFRIGPQGRWGGLWLALLMGAAYNTVAIVGMKYAPTSHASIIQTTVLILSTLGGVFLLRERFSPLQAVGVALSVIGIILLLASNGDHNPSQWIGHAMFILGGAMWTSYTLTMRRWRADPIQVSAAVCCLSAIYFLPVYFLFLPSNLTWEHWHEAAFQAFYQGIVNSVLALICYNRAVSHLGASATSTFLPLIPIVASLIAMPVLGEYPSVAEWSGLALAAIGVVLATGILKRRKTPVIDSCGAASGN